nr:phosphoglucomutase, cytoplasmic [Tanacetum cinerariifolium]
MRRLSCNNHYVRSNKIEEVSKDFGIKYNMGNGGPAPEGITDQIYENTKTIKEYFLAEGLPDVDISAIGISKFSGPDGQFDVDVFDAADDYVKLMKSIFDFESMKKLIASPQFSFWCVAYPFFFFTCYH